MNAMAANQPRAIQTARIPKKTFGVDLYSWWFVAFLVVLLWPSDTLAQISHNEIERERELKNSAPVEMPWLSEPNSVGPMGSLSCNSGDNILSPFTASNMICGYVEEITVKRTVELTIKTCKGEIFGISDPNDVKKFRKKGLPGYFKIEGASSIVYYGLLPTHIKPSLAGVTSVTPISDCSACGAPAPPPPTTTSPPPTETSIPTATPFPPTETSFPTEPPLPTATLRPYTEIPFYTETSLSPATPASPAITWTETSGYLETEPPRVKLIVSGKQISPGVYRSPAEIQIEVVDGSRKSDISRIEYKLNTDNQAKEYNGPFTLDVNQRVTLYAYAIDLAGNRSEPAQVFLENGSSYVPPKSGGGLGIGILIFLVLVAGSATYMLSLKRQKAAIGASSSPASLLFLNGPLAGRQSSVNGTDIVIGRGSSSALRFIAPGVSRQHARLQYNLGHWYLHDLSSTGTFVNDQRIDSAEVRNGDYIRMGNVDLQFHTSSAGIDGDGRALLAATQAKLTVHKNRQLYQTILLSNPPFIIGRGAASYLRLDDSSVSRSHARISLMQGRWYIQDLKSTYGTKVNGYRIAGIPLNNGDIVQIGPFEIIVSL